MSIRGLRKTIFQPCMHLRPKWPTALTAVRPFCAFFSIRTFLRSSSEYWPIVLPGLVSVYDHGLIERDDPVIFRWARDNNFAAILTADIDLAHLVDRVGQPPKIIRIDRCEVRSKIIEQLLRREAIRIHDFLKSKRDLLRLKLPTDAEPGKLSKVRQIIR